MSAGPLCAALPSPGHSSKVDSEHAASADVIAVRSGPSEGIAMINLSLRRYLPGWFRSETGDFYLTILFAAAATTALTYWFLSLPL